MKHSRSMARGDFFSHYGKRGSSPIDRVRRTGYLSGSRRWRVAENIGWGSGSRSTPRAMVKAWMRSRSHRVNILRGAFRDVGVGVVRGAPVKGYGGAVTYTIDFGRR